MRRPEVDVPALAAAITPGDAGPFGTDDLGQALTEAKYEGYLKRQSEQIERFRRLESMRIPDEMNYSEMDALRYEAREHFIRVSPRTLGQAGRISGITPADVTVLWVYLKGRRSRGSHRAS
jgi:tRNA uridine 5-carboxymethylaminomethyl modification enzyme